VAGPRSATSLARAEALGEPELINVARLYTVEMMVANGDIDRAIPLAHQPLEEALEADDVVSQGYACHLLGDCALLRSDCEVALDCYRRALDLTQRRGDLAQAAIELEGIAMTLAGLARPELTLRLAGAVQAAHRASGVVDDVAFWLALKDRWHVRARDALGEERATAAFSDGEQLDLAQAIAEALDPMWQSSD
jgi:hypothetical protein